MAPRRTTEDRFFAKVEQAGDCWLWTSATNVGGYGVFGVGGGRTAIAHRWAYHHMVAEVPDGLQLDHLCRNRACVNPYHLDPVTPRVNMDRALGANGHKKECPSGHPYSPANTYRKNGRRYCRACIRRHSAAHQRKIRQAVA